MADALVVLRLQAGTEPISGEISDARGTRAFVGWAEMVAAVEAARAAGVADAHDPVGARREGE